MGEYRKAQQPSCSWANARSGEPKDRALCPYCLLHGYCRSLIAKLVSDADLDNPHFICDVRAMLAKLGIKPDSAHDRVIDLYRDFSGRIVDGRGREMFLATELLEDAPREFWRTICRPCSPECRPRMRSKEAREWYRIIATILKSRYPMEASMWGVRAANDNRKPSGI